MLSPLLGASIASADLFPLLLALVAGAGAIYLLLPRPRPFPSVWGGAAGAIALLLCGAFIVRTGTLRAEPLLFYFFSGTAVISGALLVTQHRPARAALSFALVVLSVSGLFLLLAAPFLAAASVTVYAGAIIVTFLFVIMLAQQAGADDADSRSREPMLSTLTGFLLLGALAYVLLLSYEKHDTVRVIDQILVRMRRAHDSGEDLTHFAFEEEVNAPLRELIAAQEKRGLAATELVDVRARIEPLIIDWPTNSPDEASIQLDKIVVELKRARQRHGFLQASGSATHVPLSNQSGPAANEPAEQLRYGPDGRPLVPHDNAAYLGRSLFTDYLLPVELGGVLLLVATVGAIAIAHRVQPERRS
jgi:NADH:ubiquinone oxidoreductase subunit 6 (subunit J)